MDPVGSWSAYAASYNRLAGAAGSGGDYPHHLAATNPGPAPSTTSPLLLQAAHATSPPAFTPGSFLSPPPVGYDPVFSPFLHHANQKAHYTQALNAAQHRQPIKQGPAETDTLRENYSPVHPQPLPHPNPAFFEQASGSVQPSTIPWSHQGSSHSQLPSPFGILPHESVVGSSPAGPGSKLPYENFNPAHFAAAQTLSHINSQLVAVSYSDATKRLTSHPLQSPPSKHITPTVTSSGFYQQGTPNSNQVYSGVTGSVQQSQAHSIMSTSTTSSPKDINLSHSQMHPSSATFPSQILEKTSVEFQSPTTKNPTGPSKLSERRDSGHDSTQSSPISFAVMDAPHNRSTSKAPTTRSVVPQQSQLQQQLLNHQKTGTYRGFSSSSSTPESEYNQASGGRNTASTDAGYSSGSSVHNGIDTALQRSPLDSHVTSPSAYPAYHSPMTSMSSPSPVQHVDQNGSYKQHPSPQITPTSPMDASLSRHPSVITRGDPNYTNDSFSQKQCWEGGEQLRSQKYSTYSSESSQNVPIQHHRSSHSATDRHLGFMESPSQSVNSVKGDPMTIVKNLQNMQQQCQATPVLPDTKPNFENPKPIMKNSGSPVKRKKSTESKSPIGVAHSDSPNRVPPPAHLNQPQPSSGYSDFEKWDVQNSQKAYSGNSTLVAQNTPYPNENLSNSSFNSHSTQQATGQTGYFPSNIQNPHNQNTAVQKKSSAVIDSSQLNVEAVVPKDDDIIGKVIVPDVEEELGFLAEIPKPVSKTMTKLIPNPKFSFMESYLKFIQGKKEESPPPKRNPLKITYLPTKKNSNPVKKESSKPKPKKKPVSPPPAQTDSTAEDDPRYFPLPKDPSSRKLNSSDSEETDYDNLIPTTTHTARSNSTSIDSADNQEKKKKPDKRNESPKRRNENPKRRNENPKRRNENPKRFQKTKKRKRSSSEESQIVPRRRTTRRKAKEKISSFKDKIDELFSDLSESDQLWSPDDSDDDDDEDEYGKAFGSGKRRKSKGRTGSRFLESSDEEKKPKPKPEDLDVNSICPVCNKDFAEDRAEGSRCGGCHQRFHTECCSLQSMERLKKLGPKRKSLWKCDSCRAPLVKNEQRNPARRNGQSRRGRRGARNKNSYTKSEERDEINATLGTEDYFPFKSGEFIVVKTDLAEEHPPIWRVDGKTLLQKYEPFDQNGEKLYRNISTYSGWTPQNKDIYEKIPVQFIVQGRSETIVRFLRSEMVDPAVEQAYLEHSLSRTAKYQDNFEVYIQTLISQALDANFLAEIFSEKDEYFLQNVEVIDRLTEDRRTRLVAAVDWPTDTTLQRAVTTWPCYNVLADLRAGPVRSCDACRRSKVHARILLYGQPYNANTLDGATPDDDVKDSKEFMICLECIKHVQLYNKLVHQKYIMYIECAKRVQEKRKTDIQKDTTVILNELLADEEWLNKLFRQVRTVWADVEKAERERKKKLGLTVDPPGSPEKDASVKNNSEDTNIDDVTVERELLVQEIKVERESDAEEDNNQVNEIVNDADDVTVSVVEEGSSQPNDVTETDKSDAAEEVSIERIPCES